MKPEANPSTKASKRSFPTGLRDEWGIGGIAEFVMLVYVVLVATSGAIAFVLTLIDPTAGGTPLNWLIATAPLVAWGSLIVIDRFGSSKLRPARPKSELESDQWPWQLTVLIFVSPMAVWIIGGSFLTRALGMR